MRGLQERPPQRKVEDILQIEELKSNWNSERIVFLQCQMLSPAPYFKLSGNIRYKYVAACVQFIKYTAYRNFSLHNKQYTCCNQGCKNIPKIRQPPQILGPWWVTCTKFRAEGPYILGACFKIQSPERRGCRGKSTPLLSNAVSKPFVVNCEM